jgi:hypothetical protein
VTLSPTCLEVRPTRPPDFGSFHPKPSLDTDFCSESSAHYEISVTIQVPCVLYVTCQILSRHPFTFLIHHRLHFLALRSEHKALAPPSEVPMQSLSSSRFSIACCSVKRRLKKAKGSVVSCSMLSQGMSLHV